MSFFGPIIIILIVSLAIYLAWYNSPSQKGKRGEQYVVKILEQLPSDYIVLNDLVFPTDKGTTQVDHIVLSKFGVFAIETKNYTGEIYGDDDLKDYTMGIPLCVIICAFAFSITPCALIITSIAPARRIVHGTGYVALAWRIISRKVPNYRLACMG